MVEQRTENPCVTGSIPVEATKKTSCKHEVFYFFIKSVTKKNSPTYYISYKGTNKKEKSSFERGSRLCQKIEVVVVSDLVMTAAG